MANKSAVAGFKMGEEKQPLTEAQMDDFKMYSGFALSGILSSIPFGVNVDPVAVAQAVKNTALAMVEAQKDITGQ